MAEFAPELSPHITHVSTPKPPERKAAHKEKDVLQELHREILAPAVMPAKHTLEAAKVKKLQKKPVPPLWETKAEFLPSTVEFFKNCGVDYRYVNPAPIGQGFTHIVFSYLPEGEHAKVIKVRREASRGYMSTGYQEDRDNAILLKKFFGEYLVPTDTRQDPKGGNYLIIQDAIKGKPVNHLTETQSVRTQLTDMARLNREMMRQTGASFDFLGVPGFFSLLRHHIRHLFSKTSSFDVSNVMVDETTGKLRIIDNDLLRFRNVPFKQRMISELGFMVNRVIMRLYFGVDLKPKK